MNNNIYKIAVIHCLIILFITFSASAGDSIGLNWEVADYDNCAVTESTIFTSQCEENDSILNFEVKTYKIVYNEGKDIELTNVITPDGNYMVLSDEIGLIVDILLNTNVRYPMLLGDSAALKVLSRLTTGDVTVYKYDNIYFSALHHSDINDFDKTRMRLDSVKSVQLTAAVNLMKDSNHTVSTIPASDLYKIISADSFFDGLWGRDYPVENLGIFSVSDSTCFNKYKNIAVYRGYLAGQFNNCADIISDSYVLICFNDICFLTSIFDYNIWVYVLLEIKGLYSTAISDNCTLNLVERVHNNNIITMWFNYNRRGILYSWNALRKLGLSKK